MIANGAIDQYERTPPDFRRKQHANYQKMVESYPVDCAGKSILLTIARENPRSFVKFIYAAKIAHEHGYSITPQLARMLAYDDGAPRFFHECQELKQQGTYTQPAEPQRQEPYEQTMRGISRRHMLGSALAAGMGTVLGIETFKGVTTREGFDNPRKGRMALEAFAGGTSYLSSWGEQHIQELYRIVNEVNALAEKEMGLEPNGPSPTLSRQ